MIGSVRNKINNHEDLMDMHDVADRKPTKNLRLVFINTDVLRSAAIPVWADKDWTSTGLWQGKPNHGWPGGADTRVHQLQSIASPSRSEKLGSVSNQVLGANNFTTTTSRTVPLQHSAARSSWALRASAGPKKSVTFNIARIHANVPSPSESPEQALLESVQHKTHKDLISALEAGCACSPDVAFFKLREHYDHVKQCLRDVEHGLKNSPSDSLLQSAKHDLLAKKRLLSIYTHFCIHIEDAISLQHRAGFEVKIRELSIQKHSNVRVRGRTQLMSGDVKIRIHHENGDDAEEMLVSSTSAPRQRFRTVSQVLL
jgi:hypothetical protein